MSALSWLFTEVTTRPWRAGFVVYVVLGVGFVFYISSARRLTANPAWDARQKAANVLGIFFMAGSLFPLVFILLILLWPLWASVFWAYQFDDDDEAI